MMTVSFKNGTVTGATRALVAPGAASGNHFAYSVGDAAPAIGGKVAGAIVYVPGNNITGVTAGTVVNIYELDVHNKVVECVAHTLVADEIMA